MRILLLLLLIALFPLRGFAGEHMQTQMGITGLHQAAMQAAMLVEMHTAPQTSANSALPAQTHYVAEEMAQSGALPHDCCKSCNSCELCHLLLAQVVVPARSAPAARPPMPQTAATCFDSADVQRAHKPPLLA